MKVLILPPAIEACSATTGQSPMPTLSKNNPEWASSAAPRMSYISTLLNNRIWAGRSDSYRASQQATPIASSAAPAMRLITLPTPATSAPKTVGSQSAGTQEDEARNGFAHGSQSEQ